ncbi:MAG TPA: energy transducer TonB [Chitinophagaceae bacterium]|nr:energy transducer TonB [Chitinophagaceae bacterium]
MKSSRLKIWAFATAGSVFFMTACNNGDYTKSPSTGSENTPANTDTTMSKTPMTDTTTVSANQPIANKKDAANRRGRVSLGKMTERKTGMKPDKDGIYEMTDVRPAYPGGQTALENYINNNVEYQQAAIDNNTEGKVDVEFVIDEKGNVTDAKRIGKELGGGLDDEAVKVISNMPKWTPGKVKGKNVKTRLVLPITYKIEQ